MLTIRAGLCENTIDYIDSYFQFDYEDEWFEDTLVKDMVLDIDNSIVESPHKVVSPVLGDISILDISTGVKALILIYKEPENEFWATACGDNCAKWIKRFGDMMDITISLEHFMDFGDNHFDCKDADTGEVMDYYQFMLNKL